MLEKRLDYQNEIVERYQYMYQYDGVKGIDTVDLHIWVLSIYSVLTLASARNLRHVVCIPRTF